MRILNIPEIEVAGAEASQPAPQAAPPVDQERMDSLENIAKSILKKLDNMEERIEALEKARMAVVPMAKPQAAPAPVAPAPAVEKTPAAKTPITLNTDAVKKNLLDKMWKYMNNDESSRAA